MRQTFEHPQAGGAEGNYVFVVTQEGDSKTVQQRVVTLGPGDAKNATITTYRLGY